MKAGEATRHLNCCVDSRTSRRQITSNSAFWKCYLGNNAECGQFVLGQPENANNKKLRQRLPTVAELYPEIVNPKLDKRQTAPLQCGRSVGSAGTVRQPDTCIPGVGDARTIVSLWTTLVPWRFYQSFNGPHRGHSSKN
jgi:hypothetical protein